jgi:signal transduction histidine kinase
VPDTAGRPPSPSLPSSALTQLERRATTLERWLVALLVVIVTAPPTVYFFTELVRARDRAEMLALHYAAMIGPQLGDAQTVGHVLEKQMEAGQWPGFMRITDDEGHELLRLGNLDSRGLQGTVHRVLPPSMAPMHEIEISVEDRSLFRDSARVLGIHVLVGLTLGLGFFRAPVRALKRAVREIEATQAQLLHSDKLSAVGEAYAGLTHEINNPLGIILSRVRLMRSQDRDRPFDADVARDLEVIERQGSRIAEIVRGMLAFTRKTELRMRETDLNEVIREVTGLVQKPFAKKGITIETDLPRSLPTIWGSPVHLQQVFLNLLNNARDAMPEGGAVVVRTARAADHVVAEVQDSGTGLAGEARGRVFEPFFTTKGEGTGLGLSVSYGIIQAHAGEIAAESEPGKGAVFRVTLPIEKRGAP